MSTEKKESVVSTALVTPVDALTGIEVLKEAKAKLKEVAEKVYKTNGKVEGCSVTSTIMEEKNIGNLIKMLASVMARKRDYDLAADELGLGEGYPVFSLGGNSVADYTADIKLRIAVINNQETLDEIEELTKSYEAIMDKSDKERLLAKRLAAFAKKHS